MTARLRAPLAGRILTELRLPPFNKTLFAGAYGHKHGQKKATKLGFKGAGEAAGSKTGTHRLYFLQARGEEARRVYIPLDSKKKGREVDGAAAPLAAQSIRQKSHSTLEETPDINPKEIPKNLKIRGVYDPMTEAKLREQHTGQRWKKPVAEQKTEVRGFCEASGCVERKAFWFLRT
jgi:hypothetical protein